jgi:hypothetical protein
VSPVKYELGFYIPEDGILHSHLRENLRSVKLEVSNVRFEVFTAVTMKVGVFWGVIVGISSQRTSVASCSLCCS